MDLKQLINEVIITYISLSFEEDFVKMPKDKKIEKIIKCNSLLGALAEKLTSEPDKALDLLGVVPCLSKKHKCRCHIENERRSPTDYVCCEKCEHDF